VRRASPSAELSKRFPGSTADSYFDEPTTDWLMFAAFFLQCFGVLLPYHNSIKYLSFSEKIFRAQSAYFSDMYRFAARKIFCCPSVVASCFSDYCGQPPLHLDQVQVQSRKPSPERALAYARWNSSPSFLSAADSKAQD